MSPLLNVPVVHEVDQLDCLVVGPNKQLFQCAESCQLLSSNARIVQDMHKIVERIVELTITLVDLCPVRFLKLRFYANPYSMSDPAVEM